MCLAQSSVRDQKQKYIKEGTETNKVRSESKIPTFTDRTGHLGRITFFCNARY